MIYSKKLQNYIQVSVTKENYNLKNFGNFTKYLVKDNKITIGYVDIKDVPNGINVEFIKNQYPNLYSGFGTIADQIEVEHCLNKKLTNFTITSEAALNSHALHYKRGKRFIPDEINQIVASIIKNTPKGEKYNTSFLNRIKMYMPQSLINKYIEIIKKNPLLKKL